jgi:hypothetical protein
MSTHNSREKYNDVITKLQDYMLDEKTIQSSLEKRLENDIIKITTNKYFEQKSKERINMFTPKQKDSLFWCFYILKYGEQKYEMLENINIVLEN